MKNSTLTHILTLILFIGTFASCSKHADKPANPGNGGDGGQIPPPATETYYVKMKMDGASQSFTSGVKVLRTLSDGTYKFQIQGIKSAANKDEIDLVVYAPNEIPEGEYLEGEHDNYFILGVYAPQTRADDQGIYYGGVHFNEAAPFKIKITEITDKYAKGTFSGTFYDNDGNGENSKIITEGEFKAPLQ